MTESKACDVLNCVGNVDGQCAADICRGPKVRIDNAHRKPEQAKKIYQMMAWAFDYYFGQEESE